MGASGRGKGDDYRREETRSKQIDCRVTHQPDLPGTRRVTAHFSTPPPPPQSQVPLSPRQTGTIGHQTPGSPLIHTQQQTDLTPRGQKVPDGVPTLYLSLSKASESQAGHFCFQGASSYHLTPTPRVSSLSGGLLAR